jgi:hypothetical protein
VIVGVKKEVVDPNSLRRLGRDVETHILVLLTPCLNKSRLTMTIEARFEEKDLESIFGDPSVVAISIADSS